MKKNFIKQVFVLVLFGWGVNTAALAQNEITRKPSVSTNLIDWMLVVPNVGVEIPLSNPQFIDASDGSATSLYLEGKASLNANRVYAPDMMYKLFSGKVEYRRHFRFGEGTYQIYSPDYDTYELPKSWSIRTSNAIAKTVTSFPDSMGVWFAQDSIKKIKRMNKGRWPNRLVSYEDDLGRSYVGVFAQYADYSMCLPLFNYSKGRMGQAGIVGVSLGYQKPFYNFNNRFYLEWELGGSLGCVVSHFDKYNRVESNVVGQGRWYYPMITDLHVSLVLRKHSVKDLYKVKKSWADFTPEQIEEIVLRDSIKAEKEKRKIEAKYAKDASKEQLSSADDSATKKEEAVDSAVAKDKSLKKQRKKNAESEKKKTETVEASEDSEQLAIEENAPKAKRKSKEEKSTLKQDEKAEKERLKIEEKKAKEELALKEKEEKERLKLEKESQKLAKKKEKEQQKLEKKQDKAEK